MQRNVKIERIRENVKKGLQKVAKPVEERNQRRKDPKAGGKEERLFD
jgi:hypothetical protein